jgi:hypothetical protein
MEVYSPAQRPAVHADGRWCTWVYETRNETDFEAAVSASAPACRLCSSRPPGPAPNIGCGRACRALLTGHALNGDSEPVGYLDLNVGVQLDQALRHALELEY